MSILKDLLTAAVASGFTLTAFYDDHTDPDYRGQDVSKCIEALEACDEMTLTLYDGYGVHQGWVAIINGLDDEEQIANYSGDFIGKFHAALETREQDQ
ncbi:hypothetical protein [Phyllobacterium myrsinacearum]|uniref:Uncharacterized protein n=1 Tax=Phyllobacterium myrsinacearum TaxID=28101 RepID=A0A839ENK4_9HYPH|nr:hypothetical protein [Phyllobacterium myrsinacearum]MBA8881671.1 hypothetical protein [Phyllobacterium myrsinacearum]